MPGGGRTRERLGRVPAEVTGLVGRRSDVAEVRRLLSSARLVTLTGTGGSGKSRLAVRAATELRRAFADGVWVVDLADVTEAALLHYAIAEELGIGPSERPLPDALLEHVRDREMLLVLDNCEHLVDECAAFADRALRTAPGLRVLCTSRRVLGMAAEHVWDVAPLGVPEQGQAYDSGAETRYPGVALFVERAAAVAPWFALDAENWPTVAEICRQLDGLPLAIELAAAQLRTLSLGQLATGLREHFRHLSTRHAVPARHRGLDSAFDWDFELCSPGEQALWQRLSVFTGTFELSAAEYVFEEPVLDLLAGLIEKSVLCRVESADGLPRYRLLETVRRYGLDRLRSAYGADEERRLRRRHRDWYVDLAEQYDADWFGPRQTQWAARMRAEYANIRAALDDSLSTPGGADTGLRLAAALRFHWYAGGAGHEGRYWLERALNAGSDTTARLRGLQAYTLLLMGHGDSATAGSRCQEWLALATELGDPHWQARANSRMGQVLLLQGDVPGALRALERARPVFEAAPDSDFGAALFTLAFAMATFFAGDARRGAELCARLRETCLRRGERWWYGYVLTSSSYPAVAAGELAEAAGYLRESLRIRRELGDSIGIASSLERLAWLAAANGQPERAARLLGAADRSWRKLGRQLWGAELLLRDREECARRCQAALSAERFAALVAQGGGLSTEEAIRYALEEAEPAPAATGTPVEEGRLSPRERQVAELIAQGLSNHQIATQLVTSQRTAESHVQNILRKLGFSSRAQVAAWVAGQRPHPGTG
ncbi:MAG: hypothetical protein AUG44_02615 [Actinobacteria bacterium 13_1_20CM_3_71_11]|nr:MAG: hypothetical protein AUG44_02615 [Actinobacteria bacterium 13_1_20CM_3_71_11]